MRRVWPFFASIQAHLAKELLRLFLLRLRVCAAVERGEDLHGAVVARLNLQHTLKAADGLVVAALVDVHLAEAVLREDKLGRQRGRSVVLLERLVVVTLSWRRAGRGQG